MLIAQQYHQHQAVARSVEPLVQNRLNYDQINQRLADNTRVSHEIMSRQLEILLQSTRNLLAELNGRAAQPNPPLPSPFVSSDIHR